MKGQVETLVLVALGIAALLYFTGSLFAIVDISGKPIERWTEDFVFQSESELSDSPYELYQFGDGSDGPLGRGCSPNGDYCTDRIKCETDRCIITIFADGGQGYTIHKRFAFDKGDIIRLNFIHSFIWSKIVKQDYALDVVECQEGATEWSSCIGGEKSRYVTRYDTATNQCVVEREVETCITPPEIPLPNTTQPPIPNVTDGGGLITQPEPSITEQAEEEAKQNPALVYAVIGGMALIGIATFWKFR